MTKNPERLNDKIYRPSPRFFVTDDDVSNPDKYRDNPNRNMTVLGQNDSRLLIADNNQSLSSMESTGFILDLDNKITYDTTLYSAFNMGIWYDPKPNTKIPEWFDGKPTSFTSVSEGDSASKYMQSLIVPKTDANNGRFGADLILGLLAAKKRRLNP